LKTLLKSVFIFSLMALLPLISGCGEKETNEPAIKLTASTVTSSADATTHTHTVSIPFTDISAAPASTVYQYRSSIINGHSHVIALTKQQLIDINNGMRVILTSSNPSSGIVHTHSWSVVGGNILYDKNCYNCHSNDQRGHSPMNVSFNPSQTAAVISPGSAPLSSSASTVPDPNYQPTVVVSVSGAALYAASCESCHGLLATSTKLNRSFSLIKAAIVNNSGGMASLGALSDVQLQAIADVLVK
jgi:Cytochrome C oxidase, cbb3-type, subunit III